MKKGIFDANTQPSHHPTSEHFHQYTSSRQLDSQFNQMSKKRINAAKRVLNQHKAAYGDGVV